MIELILFTPLLFIEAKHRLENVCLKLVAINSSMVIVKNSQIHKTHNLRISARQEATYFLSFERDFRIYNQELIKN
jgi:hypothetical protein